MSRLDGKTALVTGATGGIGEAIATRFVEEGSSVMLVDRSPEKLDATAGRLAGSGNMATCVADVTDEAAVADAVAATVESFGGLDILVAAAGIQGLASYNLTQRKCFDSRKLLNRENPQIVHEALPAESLATAISV